MLARPTHSANPAPESEASLAASALAHRSWAATPDRAARTANGRAAFEQRFLDLSGGDPVRAASLRKAYFLELALKSASARRRNREARTAGAA